MPHNPFAHPDFGYAALRIGLLLLIGLICVVAAERRRLARLTSSTLFLRVRSWAVIAPIFMLALFIGGFAVFLLAAFIALQAASEYGRLVGLTRRYAWLLAIGSLAGMAVAAFAPPRYFLFLPLLFFLVLTLVPIVTGIVAEAHEHIADALFGYVYIALPMTYLVFIKGGQSWGLQFLLLVGTAVALSDVCAFVVGSTLGGPKLAPTVSPGKTWAGVLGNLLGAAAGVWLLAGLIPPEWTAAGVITMVLVLGVAAVWGDLTESLIKRDFAVKDAGDSIPGFGGVLDRVDSLLFAMPLAYYGLLIADRIVLGHW